MSSAKIPRRKLESLYIYTTYNYDLYRVTVKFHTDIPKDIQLMERARNRSLTYQREISQKVKKKELSLTHWHDLL